MPRSPNDDHRVLPARPCLVFTTTTPLAAAVPYSADADGPLMMSIDSTSSGSRLVMPPAPVLTRILSITTNGSLLSDSDVVPRTRITGADPMTLEFCVTITPDARAASISDTLVIGADLAIESTVTL